MSTPLATLTNQQQINSTTYADLLGVLVNLPRLPGETSQAYFDRLSRGATSDRSFDYTGLVDEINLQLGLNTYQGIALSGPTGVVNMTIAGVTITDPNDILTPATSSLMTLDVDGIWTWRMLSNIVADITSNGNWTAELIGTDAPAIQLAKQTNQLIVRAYPLSGQNFNLGKNGIIVGSELFSTTVPSYTLTAAGSLIFSQPVPTGTQITYRYTAWPYNLVCSEASILGLIEPNIAQVALTPDNTLVYDIQEYIQAIMSRDLSYWGA